MGSGVLGYRDVGFRRFRIFGCSGFLWLLQPWGSLQASPGSRRFGRVDEFTSGLPSAIGFGLGDPGVASLLALIGKPSPMSLLKQGTG